ncbi:hypothetical protein [Lacticaseibacillus porcinae]|uniref:hypothetical protein n=1 Tax=Lacticaseibacillus porcinae TaxID=1123687 RepID=UPI000F7AE089|nr:hypothetical protein [Lacticaseibacillus porcinae]
MKITTLSEAIALDQTIKQASSRLFVLYRPAYQDLRGESYSSEASIWLRDPDDSDSSVRVGEFTNDYVQYHLNSKMLLAPLRQKMLQNRLDDFHFHSDVTFLDPHGYVDDSEFELIRVDQLDEAQVARDLDRIDRAEADRESKQDFSRYLHPVQLAQLWADDLISSVSGRPMGMGLRGNNKRVGRLSDQVITQALTPGFTEAFEKEHLQLNESARGGAWPQYVRLVINGSDMRIVPARQASSWMLVGDLDKLAGWCGLARVMHQRGWYCNANAHEVTYWQAEEQA